jgi:hypothetical protein
VSKRQQKFYATVLVYISPKRQRRYPANSVDIYQQKKQQKFSAIVLVYISPKRQRRYPANNADIYQQKRKQRSHKAAYGFCPQCWYLTAE